MELESVQLVSRLLLTVATLGYSLATAKADLNRTHATNPPWTPHARFHVVWQIASYAGLGILGLVLIWMPGSLSRERLYLAAGLAAIVYGAFFVAAFSRRAFGGRLFDENGYPPFRPYFGPATWRWDVNVTVFAILSLLLIASVLTI
jgi:hypothetical protein